MSEKKTAEVTEVVKAEVAEVVAGKESSYVLHFDKPYCFEGKVYKSIDLSGVQDIKAADMIEGQKHISRNGEFSATPELSLDYSCFIASKISGEPIEFFYGLPAREALKLKNRMTGFFYGTD